MKQVAWLNTAPKHEDKGNNKVEEKQLTRLETLKDEGREPHYPHLESAQHVLNYLFEVGPTMSTGMGVISLTNGELQSWQSNACVRLRPWEARFICRLSKEYLSMTHEAEEIDCPAPCDVNTDDDREIVSIKVQNLMRDRIKQ